LFLSAGSPVLGYLAAGVLIGPYSLSIIKNVHGTKMIAEFGVVFLLFNIGLEVTPIWYHVLQGLSSESSLTNNDACRERSICRQLWGSFCVDHSETRGSTHIVDRVSVILSCVHSQSLSRYDVF
jgi:hypothetical protein